MAEALAIRLDPRAWTREAICDHEHQLYLDSMDRLRQLDSNELPL
jgi:hypothetical protein